MITKESALEAISQKIALLSVVTTPQEFDDWKNSTIITIRKIDGDTASYISRVKASRIDILRPSGDFIKEAKKSIVVLLENLAENINKFGMLSKEDKPEKSSVNVHVNQHTHQTQSTNVSIQLDFLVEILKDELKGAQIKELRAIIESDEEPEVKKKSFVEKIMSFGSDVASNILANLFTNPQVYSQLAGML